MSWNVRVTGGCLLAALALGACGGGSSVSAPQKAQAQKADAICLEAQDVVGKTLGDEPDKELAALQTAAQKLQALKPPSENETIWTQFVGEMNNLWLSMLDQVQSLDPSTNDKARAQRAVDRAMQTNDRVKVLAAKYTMVECAKGFGRT